jgi:FG-GAP-like repeat
MSRSGTASGWHRRTGKLRAASVMVCVLVAGLVAGVGPAEAATTVPTFARTDHPSLANHNVVGDFNGDGRLDLAGLALPGAGVILSTGDGTFGPRATYPVAESSPQDIATGDFDGDGRLDLAVTINTPDNSLSLLGGNGDGTFKAPVNFPNTSGFDSPAIVATDLNNDGRLDIVIGHSIGCFTAPCVVARTISVMLGNGDGTFAPTREIEVGTGIAEIAVGDFDRDGIKDLAIAGDRAQLYRLRGVGDGTFVQQPTITLVANNFAVDGSDVDVADFNGDSIEDLVVAIATNGSRTAVLIGNGSGGFGSPLILTDPGLNVPQFVAVGDYNLDGFQDLAMAMANGNSGLMQTRNGNGDGTFQGPVNHQVPPNQSSIGGVSIISARLNSDNRSDIALAWGGASSGMAVLRNSTGVAPPPTPAAPTLVSPANQSTPAQPVGFDWSDVNAATTYRIQIDDSSTFTTPLVVNEIVTASQFTAPVLAARQHFWRVRAINSAGVSGPFSTVRRFTPQSPPSAPASLSSVAVSPSSVAGGSNATGTVRLTSAAPTGGFAVSLSSSSGTATVPASATVPGGATSTTFPITTSAVASSTPVTITASAGGVVRTATLTVTPPASTATLTVTATGRGGERVTSSPSGINVAVGSTGSAPFNVGTSITLSVTNGRDAIWSGACSSGGNKSRTCTFTLNGNASVTANVQ